MTAPVENSSARRSSRRLMAPAVVKSQSNVRVVVPLAQKRQLRSSTPTASSSDTDLNEDSAHVRKRLRESPVVSLDAGKQSVAPLGTRKRPGNSASNSMPLSENESPSDTCAKKNAAAVTDENSSPAHFLEPLEILQQVKRVLRTSSNPQLNSRENNACPLAGREREWTAVSEFWDASVGQRKPAALYLSGPPGTGKTLLVETFLSLALAKDKKSIKVVKLNCMTVQAPGKIYSRLYDDLTKKPLPVGATALDRLETILLASDKTSMMHVFILDEMDHLMTKDQSVLYRIFEWTAMQKSTVVVIGMANTLDLTGRFLPRLKALNCTSSSSSESMLILEGEPSHVPFIPYDVSQMVSILQERLRPIERRIPPTETGEPGGPLMPRPAMELIARRVVVSSDLRKLFDIARLTFELHEQLYRSNNKKPLRPASPTNDAAKVPLPPVSIGTVSRALQSTLGAINPSVAKLQSLTTHQKALVLLATLDKAHAPVSLQPFVPENRTLQALYRSFAAVVDKTGWFAGLSQSEFSQVITGIDDLGLWRLSKKQKQRALESTMIESCVTWQEIGQAVEASNLPTLKLLYDGRLSASN